MVIYYHKFGLIQLNAGKIVLIPARIIKKSRDYFLVVSSTDKEVNTTNVQVWTKKYIRPGILTTSSSGLYEV